MGARAVVSGLRRSAFIADIDVRDRAPLPILGAFALGLPVAAVAGMATLMLSAALYLLATGQGGLGPPGVAQLLKHTMGVAAPSPVDTFLRLWFTAGVSAVFFLALVAVAAACSRKPLIRYATAAPRLRWRLLIVGLGLGALAIAPEAIGQRLTGGAGATLPILASAPDLVGRLIYLAGLAPWLAAAAAEELAFRGWLLRQLAAFGRGPWFLMVGVGALFAVAHLDFSLDGLLARTLMGMGFAYMTLRLGGIEFPTAVHAANNIIIYLFIEPLDLRAPPPTAGLSIDTLISDAVMILLYLAITEAVVRLPVLRRLAGLDAAQVSPLDPDAARRISEP